MGRHYTNSMITAAIVTLGCGLLGWGATGCSEAESPGADESATELGDSLRGKHPHAPPSGHEASFTTLFEAPLATEGLAVDRAGNLYTAGRGGDPCPVWRIPTSGGGAAIVGTLPAPCNPNGLTFDRGGTLYVTSGADRIYALKPNAAAPPVATVFASGVPGANGLAFDHRGHLWATDGGTGQGRVWSIAPDGTPTEKLRIQPLANTVNVVDVVLDTGATVQVGGVGRDARALPPGKLTVTPTSRAANDATGSVAIVSNGIAFDRAGDLLVTDTARGAIWKVRVDRHGKVRSSLGCDTTFTPNTLCLENLFVQHPALEGIDGIVIDSAGTIWAAVNERNAIVSISEDGKVRELFRNAPDPTTLLRNTGPLEFPTSPVLVGKRLCIAQTDVARRDNFPNAAGEVGPPGPALAKVACLDQRLPKPAL